MNSATEYLRPEADGAVEVPGLGVNADETGDSGNRKESEDRSFWILVSFEDLCNSMGHFEHFWIPCKNLHIKLDNN